MSWPQVVSLLRSSRLREPLSPLEFAIATLPVLAIGGVFVSVFGFMLAALAGFASFTGPLGYGRTPELFGMGGAGTLSSIFILYWFKEVPQRIWFLLTYWVIWLITAVLRFCLAFSQWEHYLIFLEAPLVLTGLATSVYLYLYSDSQLNKANMTKKPTSIFFRSLGFKWDSATRQWVDSFLFYDILAFILAVIDMLTSGGAAGVGLFFFLPMAYGPFWLLILPIQWLLGQTSSGFELLMIPLLGLAGHVGMGLLFGRLFRNRPMSKVASRTIAVLLLLGMAIGTIVLAEMTGAII
jgi:hypothetical protein